MNRLVVVLVGCVICVAKANPAGPAYPDPPSGALARCDGNVVAAIERYWSANGMPQNLIWTAINNNKEVVVETSYQYYADRVSCVYSYFTGTSANSASVLIRYVLKNSNGFEEKTTQIVESGGTTYDSASLIRRYHVLYECGVTAEYVCSESPNAQPGSPSGFIKISEDGFEYPKTTRVIEKARSVLKMIGVEMQTYYGLTCPKSTIFGGESY